MAFTEAISAKARRRYNWRIWVGFLLAIAGFISYFAVFVKFPITRDVPWVTWLIFAVSLFLLAAGIARAVRQPLLYRGKILGPIVGVLGLGIVVVFGFITLYGTRQVPPSAGAPKVGSKAPDFALEDITGKTVTLASLLSEPLPPVAGSPAGAKPRGVVLVFYRGYW